MHLRPQPGRSSCALAAETLSSSPGWTRIWIGACNGTPRPGPPGKPMCATRRRPGTDSDGTSPTAFTTARMGGGSAWTRLPPSHATCLTGGPTQRGRGRQPSFHIRPARGPSPQGSSTTSKVPRGRIAQTNTGRDPSSITGNVHTAHDRGNNRLKPITCTLKTFS